MATIRMSANLTYEINRNIENMFMSRLSAAKAAAEKEVGNYAEEVLELIVPKELLSYVYNHPEHAIKFMGTTRQLYVNYTIEGLHFSSCFTYNRNIPEPRTRYFTIDKNSAPGLYAKIARAQETYVSVIKEKTELLAQTKVLLNSVATFKQLLDVWPSAIEFVSEEVKKRHYAKQTYTKRAKPVVQLDEKIKANLLKARIASDIGKS